MNKAIELKPDDAENYYAMACLYSLMNQEQEALTYLELTLQKANYMEYRITNEKEFDNIRNSQGYKDLMAKYKK